MKKMKFNRLLRVALAIALLVSFISVPRESLFAASLNTPKPGNKVVANDDVYAEVTSLAEEAREVSAVDGNAAVAGPEDSATGNFSVGKNGSKSSSAKTDPTGNVSISAPNSDGIVTIKGSISGSKFTDVYVDKTLAKAVYSSTIDTTVDMSKYSYGYHTIYIYTKSKSKIYYYKDFVLSSIKTKPTNEKSQYSAYSKYISYYTSDNYCEGCGICLEYKKSSDKNWKTAGTMNSVYTWFKKSKLSPSKEYKTRVCFYSEFNYKDKKYFLKGPYSETTTIKTGTKTLPLKSVKVKAYDIKRKTKKYYNDSGTYLYSKTFYQFRLKAYVKMKKKPNATGIYFGTYRIKGNKKTYTQYLGKYKRLKKPTQSRYRFSICSYQNKTYGGYSPKKTMTVKIKK